MFGASHYGTRFIRWFSLAHLVKLFLAVVVMEYLTVVVGTHASGVKFHVGHVTHSQTGCAEGGYGAR